jgi:Stress responsive A/B Barrel Domain
MTAHGLSERTMIRNVVTGRLRETANDEERHADLVLLEEGLAAIAALRLPGQLDMQVGRDLGLREGGWDFAITNDWADVEAYRGYDADPEHNRIRREYMAVVSAQIVRVQFILPD